MNTLLFCNCSPTLLETKKTTIWFCSWNALVLLTNTLNKKPTELPTELSNITTGDSKYPQSLGVGGLWRREVFRRQWCVYLSSCGEPTTWQQLRAHDSEEIIQTSPETTHWPQMISSPGSSKTLGSSTAADTFYTHLHTHLNPRAATGRRLSERTHSSPTEKSEDIGRTRTFRTFHNTVNKDIVWHKIKVLK